MVSVEVAAADLAASVARALVAVELVAVAGSELARRAGQRADVQEFPAELVQRQVELAVQAVSGLRALALALVLATSAAPAPELGTESDAE
jgi:hypothetical protein